MVRERLRDLLVRHSYRYDPAGNFQLVSGKKSDTYVDCKATTMRGEAMAAIGELVVGALPGNIQAVGGLTMGADPIAHAAAAWASVHGRALDAFSVRKEAKKHGLKKWIEGCASRGTVVAVLDDVATTGGSTVDAIGKCREEGLRVAAVVVLVDRQEGGLENIRQAAGPDVAVTALFTKEELKAARAAATPTTSRGDRVSSRS